MKQIRCGDVGYFPKCDAIARGETDEEAIEAVFAHGMEAHKWPIKIRMWVGRQPFVERATARARAAIRDT